METVLTLARDDALPDGYDYRDDGCDLHPASLTCPFEQCQYESQRTHYRNRLAERDAAIVALRRQGLSVDQIVAEMGISRRTVYRILRLDRVS